MDDETSLTSFEDIKKVAFSHCESLCTESRMFDGGLRDQSLSYIPHLVQDRDNEELVKPVTEEEILAALMQFEPDKDPGLDGFTAHFYKKCWHIIKFDLVRMIQYVQKSARMGGATNLTLALIPKEQNALHFPGLGLYLFATFHIRSCLKL